MRHENPSRYHSAVKIPAFVHDAEAEGGLEQGGERPQGRQDLQRGLPGTVLIYLYPLSGIM